MRDEIGRRRGGGIERLPAIAELHANLAAGGLQPDVHSLLHSLAAPVPHGVNEQLFQHQVQIELHLGVERTLAAEALALRPSMRASSFRLPSSTNSTSVGIARLCHIRRPVFNVVI